MKQFTIRMPITGVAVRVIQAETEEQAINKFHEEVTSSDIDEWECTNTIVKGNVFYGIQNEIDVQEEEINEED